MIDLGGGERSRKFGSPDIRRITGDEIHGLREGREQVTLQKGDPILDLLPFRVLFSRLQRLL